MVLFKRKPVRFLEPPRDLDDSAEVWHIPQTGEIFPTYEEYLNRLEFYKQSRFICQITGHSNLTFFEALRSELAGAQEVDQAFPEALKGPVLRRVQFQTVSRIDHLVDMVFEEFKADYYPGESVGVQLSHGDRHQGLVREKAKFGSKVLPDGTLTQPYTLYLVSLDDRAGEEAQVDSEHIWRDRKIFTKSVLRSFIKKTVTREAWNGAPWLVKHDVAARYHIDTRVPPQLRYDNKLLERKQLLAQKKGLQPVGETNGNHGANRPNGIDGTGVNPFTATGPMRLPELKPAPKSHKAKHLQQPPPQPTHFGKGKQNGLVDHLVHSPDFTQHLPLAGNPFQFPVSFRSQAPAPPPMYVVPEPPPPPPPPKYPIEDLQLEPQGRTRPRLNFLCHDGPAGAQEASSSAPSGLAEKILMKSVGPLLETWDTLNVYCEVFKLDSFTFESYVEALIVASEEVRPQLYDEIHCAVLSILVSSEKDGGKPQVPLPELDDDEDGDDGEGEQSAEPTPEPQPKPTGRATRSSLAKLEAERLANEAAAAEKEVEKEEAAVRHRAEDVLAEFDWVEQLAKRNFQDGGWEHIMVGLLHQLSKEQRHKISCEDLLSHLVPADVEPTRETIRQHYATMDVNLRVTALQIICMLTADTKAVRAYMEECSETMTEYRKNKIEFQRQRKQAIEELKALNEERKILLPDNMPPSPQPEPVKLNGVDSKSTDREGSTPTVEDDTMAEAEDEAPVGRGLRRAQDRAAQRQRKRELEAERKREAEAAAKTPKPSKQFLKVLKEIDKKEDEIKKCEAEIAVIDNDLREADCPRTRVLGKDRFWNRYYWFERNGMPYGGLPDSSTASAGYANGCIWVQGPDELEREGYIDMPADLQAEYKAKFGLTVPERKEKEEAPTSLLNARQWGFISEPEDLIKLIEWLDPRGFNELKLRKELVQFRDKIETHMRNRKAYLEAGEQPREEAAEKKSVPSSSASSKRVSTRTRVVQTPEPPQYRCLEWENLTAINELGHLHSAHPPPPRVKKPSRKKEAADAAAAPEKKKPLSRQGTRYNF
ncbi:hypothetical protein MAPG_07942 [Magnaporthiopsis poae ATCC 64411]|uniref:DDT domain-containing protein n=1 Tax=Magnaporthiopsis poae (strain ATCC 64411 / 73-15) TaxID=644358 RepID=A0A0C4E613_MAGP6|nr:hypothetical protein MAPG_07942 [Magnaporthiopsis poae ATCC 64411]